MALRSDQPKSSLMLANNCKTIPERMRTANEPSHFPCTVFVGPKEWASDGIRIFDTLIPCSYHVRGIAYLVGVPFKP